MQATGKKKLVIAGIVTEVCVAFVSLSALAAGYEVRCILRHLCGPELSAMQNGSVYGRIL